MCSRLGYSQSESPQTTNALTRLGIPESTAHFGLPSYPTLTGITRALILGLVRSLGLAESNSANLRWGCRSRPIAHSHDIDSPLVEWYKSGSIEALGNFYLLPKIDFEKL